ncbi:hypothetical protein CSUI_002377 [Cystoisospora suis]|uniref:Uncharacterized protein n=1 Tax=Cystoisospora suis TaxID=483139 RepID=A0A2C6L9K3_9APIC|nr:hypothetical protein CSUI_002377 [Cystoisospora suis]
MTSVSKMHLCGTSTTVVHGVARLRWQGYADSPCKHSGPQRPRTRQLFWPVVAVLQNPENASGCWHACSGFAADASPNVREAFPLMWECVALMAREVVLFRDAVKHCPEDGTSCTDKRRNVKRLPFVRVFSPCRKR